MGNVSLFFSVNRPAFEANLLSWLRLPTAIYPSRLTPVGHDKYGSHLTSASPSCSVWTKGQADIVTTCHHSDYSIKDMQMVDTINVLQ
jgi:hypothetical protein